MGMAKYRMPTEEELAIIRRNGIDPDGVCVSFRSEDTICLLRYKTRDEIVIRQGDRNWKTYQT